MSEFPDAVHKMDYIIQSKGWQEAIDWDVSRRLNGFPEMDDPPDQLPLKNAHKQVKRLEKEKGIDFSEEEFWKTVAVILAGKICARNIRIDRIKYG